MMFRFGLFKVGLVVFTKIFWHFAIYVVGLDILLQCLYILMIWTQLLITLLFVYSYQIYYEYIHCGRMVEEISKFSFSLVLVLALFFVLGVGSEGPIIRSSHNCVLSSLRRIVSCGLFVMLCKEFHLVFFFGTLCIVIYILFIISTTAALA